MGPLPTLIPDAKRPANKDVAANHVEFTVPQGWSVTITAVSSNKKKRSLRLATFIDPERVTVHLYSSPSGTPSTPSTSKP